MQRVETAADPRTTPVLAGGARTPVGRFRGALSEVPAVELGAHAVRAALARCPGLSPEYAAMGNVLQAANGQNPGRRAAVLGGAGRAVPGVTLNDVCLASMSSVALGAGMIRAGEAGCVLVGGFDSMTGAPHAVHMRGGDAAGDRRLIDVMQRDGLWCGIAGSGMGELSDAENDRLGIDRARQDAFALESHRRAAAARDSGRLGEEVAPIKAPGGELRHDEGIRADTSAERLAALPPAFTPAGTITAGNASQLSDAAAAGVLASLQAAREAGVRPLAEIVGRAVVAGPDSTLHLRPAEAARKLLAAHQLTAGDIDLWEINEAFAGVALASIDALGIDPGQVNVNGGAIAVGHPLAASGFRLLLTLAIELQHRGATHAIATMCGGGGQGEAILLRTLGDAD
jgi:acetyl-CoA C-acetyltransferase